MIRVVCPACGAAKWRVANSVGHEDLPDGRYVRTHYLPANRCTCGDESVVKVTVTHSARCGIPERVKQETI